MYRNRSCLFTIQYERYTLPNNSHGRGQCVLLVHSLEINTFSEYIKTVCYLVFHNWSNVACFAFSNSSHHSVAWNARILWIRSSEESVPARAIHAASSFSHSGINSATQTLGWSSSSSSSDSTSTSSPLLIPYQRQISATIASSSS
jgi:hypothetical protein